MDDADSLVIRSERLDLVLLSTHDLYLTLRPDAQALERSLQCSVPQEWYEPEAFFHLRIQQMEEDPGYLPWGLRAIVVRDQKLMVGFVNFHSQPGAAYLLPYSNYAVEFGYTVFTAFRRQGYAREASLALMKWAYEEKHVPEFILSIAPDNLPSRRLAEGMGFVQVGTSIDEVDGPEDVFRLRYAPA
jgi:RimJ/RimL family protein N-acetyltransferase